ncbi:hypothetical protein CI102_8397 [Trichoderma harzianum]|nr:hypothetical protein CI102_8397 [Trichoderma harzianum]
MLAHPILLFALPQSSISSRDQERAYLSLAARPFPPPLPCCPSDSSSKRDLFTVVEYRGEPSSTFYYCAFLRWHLFQSPRMSDTVMLLLHIRSTITATLISQSVLCHFVIANGWLALSLVSAAPRHTRKIHGLLGSSPQLGLKMQGWGIMTPQSILFCTRLRQARNSIRPSEILFSIEAALLCSQMDDSQSRISRDATRVGIFMFLSSKK